MNDKMYLGYFMKDDKVIDESLGGYEIFAIEKNGLYYEMLTSMEFERAKYENNKGLTFLPCQRIDTNVRNKDIVRYKLLYNKKDIYTLLDRINSPLLVKRK